MDLRIDRIKVYDGDQIIGEAHLYKMYDIDKWSSCVYSNPTTGVFIGSFSNIFEAKKNIIKKYKEHTNVHLRYSMTV